MWQRIKGAFSAGIPNSIRRSRLHRIPIQARWLAAKRRDAAVTPEAALSKSEQRRRPPVTGAGQVVGGITSPESAALIAGTAGLGELPGATPLVVPRLLSAGFGLPAITSAYQTSKAARDAFERGDTSEGERLLTAAILSGGMAWRQALTPQLASQSSARHQKTTQAQKLAGCSGALRRWMKRSRGRSCGPWCRSPVCTHVRCRFRFEGTSARSPFSGHGGSTAGCRSAANHRATESRCSAQSFSRHICRAGDGHFQT